MIHVEGAEGVTVSRFGILSINARPDAPIVAYRLKGFGLVPGQGGATLGYRSEQVAIVRGAEDCRVVLFNPSGGQREKDFWNKLLAGNSSICAINGGSK
ncbi:hypothetical protein ASE85_11475 [Sphingobium sp. Leaf26]|nr:hypothetical protein ASE85_11475 [Sphingobium sp. Leaf26]